MKSVLKNKVCIVVLVAVLFSSNGFFCLAEDGLEQNTRPQLVSFFYHYEGECRVCGKKFTYELENKLWSELEDQEKYSYSYYTYKGNADRTKYECSGRFCIIEPDTSVGYAHKYKGDVEDVFHYPKDATDHLLSHGEDENGTNPLLRETGSGYYYDETFKDADGNYFKLDSENVQNPPFVKIKKVIRGKRSVTIKWKKAAKKQFKLFTGYQIQYSRSSDFSERVKTKIIKKKTASKAKIGKLKRKTTYYVRLRRFKKKGSKTYYSKWSPVKRVRTK